VDKPKIESKSINERLERRFGGVGFPPVFFYLSDGVLGEFADVVDAVFFAPVEIVVQPVFVALDGLMCFSARLVVQIQLD